MHFTFLWASDENHSFQHCLNWSVAGYALKVFRVTYCRYTEINSYTVRRKETARHNLQHTLLLITTT
uniref:Uncharacterized protein n=1 Tax=Anguilla anguilla TaxID=7936 RepID=A0A0E9UUW6_ANGAN